MSVSARFLPARLALFTAAVSFVACVNDPPRTAGGAGGGRGGATTGAGGQSPDALSGGGVGAGDSSRDAGGGGGSAGGGMGTGGGADARPGVQPADAAVDRASIPPVPDAAATPDGGASAIRPLPAPPAKRAGFTVFHSTNVSAWEIKDPAVYQQYKPAYDEIIDLLERGYFGIERRLGTGHKLPIRVIIEAGSCCGGWAGGGDVGYSEGNFRSAGGLQWTRGVVIGEVVNGVTGAVTGDWPRDWWADTAWYYPGFVAADVLKELNPAAGMKWETDEKYLTYPTYVLFKALMQEKGWEIYQRLFQLVKTDKIRWAAIGANPSALKTNYVVAYLSLAYGQNLGERFRTAGKVEAASGEIVRAIMEAHTKLTTAGAGAPGWTKFRSGDYQGAGVGL